MNVILFLIEKKERTNKCFNEKELELIINRLVDRKLNSKTNQEVNINYYIINTL